MHLGAGVLQQEELLVRLWEGKQQQHLQGVQWSQRSTIQEAGANGPQPLELLTAPTSHTRQTFQVSLSLVAASFIRSC